MPPSEVGDNFFCDSGNTDGRTKLFKISPFIFQFQLRTLTFFGVDLTEERWYPKVLSTSFSRDLHLVQGDIVSIRIMGESMYSHLYLSLTWSA